VSYWAKKKSRRGGKKTFGGKGRSGRQAHLVKSSADNGNYRGFGLKSILEKGKRLTPKKDLRGKGIMTGPARCHEVAHKVGRTNIKPLHWRMRSPTRQRLAPTLTGVLPLKLPSQGRGVCFAHQKKGLIEIKQGGHNCRTFMPGAKKP